MAVMVTVVRICLPMSTMWGSYIRPRHKTFQFAKERHATRFSKSSHRNCTTINSMVEDVAGPVSVPEWKWRLVISYDGTQYSGWQMQPHCITIQHMIEDALSKFTRCPRDQLKVVAAGRTDAGVHAWGQVAHFVTPYCFDNLIPLHLALNAILPAEIRIREISPVHPDFHARHSACRKRYQYKAYMSPVMDPFQHNYAHHVQHNLNVAAMQEAASYFVGKHNFSAFANMSADNTMRGAVRELLSFSVLSMGPQLLFEVEGKAFLYKQVRNMVGLLIEVGKESVTPQIVSAILATENRRELAKVSSVAPSNGLYLMSVNYDCKLLEPLPDMPQTSYGQWKHSATHSLRSTGL